MRARRGLRGWPPPARAAGRIIGLVIAFALAVTVGAPPGRASAAYGPPGAPQPNPAFAIPLAGSLTSGGTTWATVVMGRNDGDFDLFWQLFSLDATTGRYALVTPPGVADNGGLMTAPTGQEDAALVGFGASQDLRFSPLAFSTDAGRSWSPGGLPAALVPAPSVLTAAASGSALALVEGGGQRVLERSGGLTSWKTLATGTSLGATPAGRTCAIGSLEAVALAPGGTPLVGASCRRPDAPGVLVDSDRQWHLADIPVPVALADDVFATLRLEPTSALFAGVHGHATTLVAAWAGSSNRPWQLSPPLAIGSSANLLASGTGPGTTQFVLVRVGGVVRAETIAGPGTSWAVLPTLPAHTATLAIAPGSSTFALAVDVSELTVWELRGSGRAERWEKSQTIAVPIAYGSSS